MSRQLKIKASEPLRVNVFRLRFRSFVRFERPITHAADVFDPSSVRPVSSEQMPLRSKHGIAGLRYGSRLLNLPRSLTPCSQSMKHTQ